MPEGPEARTVSDKLRPFLLNKLIISAYKGERGRSLGFENLKFPSTVTGVRVYGKKIFIDIVSPTTNLPYIIVVSLGMTGRLQYNRGNHSHIYFVIGEYHTSGSFRIMRPSFTLFFDDYRYMGSVDFVPTSNIGIYLGDIGPDLLAASLSENTWIPSSTWISIFTQKKIQTWTICKALLDQRLVAGVGNYLKAEVLYYSGILPERVINTITPHEWETLRVTSHKIILLSYSYGGFTLKDFISPDGQCGEYPAAVYGKKQDPYGNLVVSGKTSDRRTSYWVPSIQR